MHAKECGGVEKYIEVSTAQVYEPHSKPQKETSKLKPWSSLAQRHLQAEQAIAPLGLPLIIVRLPVVYGPGDRTGLMPRIICAATYKHTGEKMTILWSGDLRVNTVHVRDVAAGLWFLAKQGPPGSTFNLVDKNETNQKKINKLLGEIFGIQTGFVGTGLSFLGTKFTKLDEIANEANAGHMEPWAEMCKTHSVDTNLSPFIDKELLADNALSVDGSKLYELGFQPRHPEVNVELLLESINYWKELKQFPPVV
eukprot:NODE_175_length_1718_cov_42.236669_g121_i0.p1 GENE.NODE_175_length_1718_cov_42.236669_g121_i0~~NODE_175_length_1718_cov_42.236669_g121_i0.p1  ORF type:complete len:253 (-),score=79.45 NODE_175_length_1718_cov_42.236669_g121_i0:32-790(-)